MTLARGLRVGSCNYKHAMHYGITYVRRAIHHASSTVPQSSNIQLSRVNMSEGTQETHGELQIFGIWPSMQVPTHSQGDLLLVTVLEDARQSRFLLNLLCTPLWNASFHSWSMTFETTEPTYESTKRRHSGNLELEALLLQDQCRVSKRFNE